MTGDLPLRKRSRLMPKVSAEEAATDRDQAPSASTKTSSGDFDVGYKKPPRHTRFKKGRSGNPKGRPKGAKNLKTDLSEELQERIRIKEGGSPRTVSKQRAMLKSLAAKAVQGDLRAANLIVNMVIRLFQQDNGNDQDLDLSKEDQAILENFARKSRRAKETKDE